MFSICARELSDDTRKAPPIEQQIAAGKLWGAERGFSLAAVYADDGYSGGDWNRPEWNQRARDAKRHLCLGTHNEFYKEWCGDWGKIKDPELLGYFLFKNLIIVRRTRKEAALELTPVNRIVYTDDADIETLKRMEQEMKVLAMKVITGGFREKGDAARDFDWRMRHDTGVAKAKAVCEIVKMIVETGEKVVLFGWHRDVYDIWLRELSDYYPVLFTGSETTV